ncbi:MAG: extracellular solute-binding protein [Clostridia bacterium]|nr:extracellular solute-binding protein [Clostridia bacterium]
MKKIISLVLALLMLLSCVPALADTLPADGYDGSAVTIMFRHIINKDNQLAVLNDAIAEFNKLYPNIKVELINGGTYNDILSSTKEELPAGNEPNIEFCYMDHIADYNNQKGAVQVLDELIDHPVVGLTEEQKADFIPGYYKEGASFGDGKMYALPFYKSTEVLYYNKTFFDANGLTVPTTWDEMEQVCAAIKALEPNSIPLGYDSEGNWFITMTEQLNSPYTSTEEPYYLFDNDTNKDFIRKFNGWYNKGYVTTAGLLGSYTSGLFTSTEEVHSYMSIGSSAGATYQRPKKNDDGTYPFEVGIVPIPQADPANQKAISQGPSVCIFAYKKSAQEIMASWLLVKYLTTDATFQSRFSIASGYMPAIKSVLENEEYQSYLAKADGGDNIGVLSVSVGMSITDAYFTSPVFPGSATARNQVTALLKACLGMKPDELEAKIDSAFQDAIDECEYAN